MGNEIYTNSPTTSGGTPTSYAISSDLPAGLDFNTSTGDITGTPTVTSAATYTVTATNAGGTSAGFGLSIQVVDLAPTMTITAKEVNGDGAVVSDGASSFAPTLFLTFDASEDITGFASGGITCTNGVISNFQSWAANASQYTAQLTPNNPGDVTVSVSSGTYADLAAQLNVHATSFTYTNINISFTTTNAKLNAGSYTAPIVLVNYTIEPADADDSDLYIVVDPSHDDGNGLSKFSLDHVNKTLSVRSGQSLTYDEATPEENTIPLTIQNSRGFATVINIEILPAINNIVFSGEISGMWDGNPLSMQIIRPVDAHRV